VLSDTELRKQWEAERTEMRERIQRMRGLFVERLAQKGVTRDFSFIKRQNGMFSYSGIALEQVRKLRSDFGLYIVDSGRICLAALNENNVDYVTDSIAKVLASA